MRDRACKIVATLGPASDAPRELNALAQLGTDCFRLNMSHGDHAGHERRIIALRDIERRLGRPICIMADLQGPKWRLGEILGGVMPLRSGEDIQIEASEESGHEGVIRLPHPEILAALQIGDEIRFDDGRLSVRVSSKTEGKITARIVVGGALSSHKGVNVPGRAVPVVALTAKDKEDAEFALALGVDFLCLSFVQTPQDVLALRALVGERAGIIAKIEKPAALLSLGQIIALADAVMVARGDLGVELAQEQVPIAQRTIIRAARTAGKAVIVATQMLDSMIDAPTPTRAEASDVANAVYQGADAVMLSAESAVGKHPAAAVAIMDKIVRAVEGDDEHWRSFARDMTAPEHTTSDAIALSAREIAEVLGCARVVAYTSTGATAQRLARERPRCGIVAMTHSQAIARRLCLIWGVRAIVTEDAGHVEDMVEKAKSAVIALGAAGAGERIVITAGIPFGISGHTNTIHIAELAKE